MKQRFSSLDVQVISHELHRHLISHRLTNIHDLSSRTFQFKFQSSATQTRHILIVDSGFRCHLTNFSRTTASSPSGFIEKLRKCIKTRRVTAVKQVGSDRVLELQFGIVNQDKDKDDVGDAKGIPGVGGYRLFFEFFAGGNVILTDAALKIIAVLRIVPEGPNQKKIARGEIYDISDRKAFGVEKVTREKIVAALKGHLEKRELEEQRNPDELKDWQKKKLKKTRKDDGLNRVLGAAMTEFSATLIEHCLLTVGVDLDLKVVDAVDNESTIDKILEAFQLGEKIVQDIMETDEVTGYIIAKKPVPKTENPDVKSDKKKKKKKVAFGEAEVKEAEEDLDALLEDEGDIVPQTDSSGYMYNDFHPFLPVQFENKPNIHTIPVPSYNKTVDSFFSSIESQKMEQQTAAKKAVAAKRLANARNEHKSKIASLHQAQELHIRKAQAIEANVSRVEEVTDAVNSLIAQGMDWGEIKNLIEREKKNGNTVAEMVIDVKFMENIVVIRLYEEEEDESDEDDESSSEDGRDEKHKRGEYLDIEIDLAATGYANARTYYEQKRSAAVKESKTLQSSAKALKSTEKKIQKDLKQAYKAEKLELRTFRRQGWWEKFYWFRSSEGYLVLGARDPTQADMLYKKYFKRGDVWIHADVPGSCYVLVKNKVEDMKAPIPPGTLSQAGTLAVAASEAWEKKMVISAWWVDFDQVTKIGAGGSVLGMGDFAIKGEKKWLPPGMLVMGFAVGWLMGNVDLDEEELTQDSEDRISEQVNGNHEPSTLPAETPADQNEEESEDEEFPDAKLESEEDDEITKPDATPSDESSDDDEFPDAKLADLSLEDRQLSQEESEEAEDVAEPLPGTWDIHPSMIDRTTASSPSLSVSSTITGSRHLSAKEKRDIKKAKQRGLSLPASALATPNGSMPPIGRKQMKPAAAPRNLSSKAAQQNIRGKKGKAKKIAEKYGDQDEEDRLLALKLLGNAKKETEDAIDSIEKEKEKERTKVREMEERQLKLKLQTEKTKAQVLADEATRKDNAEKFLDFEEELDENTLKMADLKNIIPEVKGVGAIENALDAVPICAPWPALQRFEWKVKLQPGTQKKGKAIREVVERWGKETTDKDKRKPKPRPDGLKEKEGGESEKVDAALEKIKREKEMIRGWKESEVVQCVPVGKVKIMMPGMVEEKGKGGKGGGKGGGKAGGSGGKKGKK